MIRLGYYRAATYPDTGLSLINEGKIVFKGKCIIGNNCSVVVEKNASVVFGEDFKVNAAMKLESHNYVVFGRHVLIGWEVFINDLNPESPKQQGIIIGDNNWLSTRSIVFGGVKTPYNCIFGAYSFIRHHDCSILQPNCLFGNEPLCLLKQNVMRNYHHDLITDYTLLQN